MLKVKKRQTLWHISSLSAPSRLLKKTEPTEAAANLELHELIS